MAQIGVGVSQAVTGSYDVGGIEMGLQPLETRPSPAGPSSPEAELGNRHERYVSGSADQEGPVLVREGGTSG